MKSNINDPKYYACISLLNLVLVMNQSSIYPLWACLIVCFFVLGCGSTTPPPQEDASAISSIQPPLSQSKPLINPDGQTLHERIGLPPGYQRVQPSTHSFGHYLQHLPLKPHGAPVLLFNGQEKNRQVHVAVIDIDVSNKDLQQCADAVMRLRAEYLYGQKAYDQIQFHYTNGFLADYATWRQGKRIVVQGNRCYWKSTSSPSIDYASFRKYLEQVFIYAGTLSLEKELAPASYTDLQIGDVLIQGGSPGHAVLVVDKALSEDGRPPIYLLVQSYMPAQEIHVLKNLNKPAISPWYPLDPSAASIQTPEWRFAPTNLKRF